VMQQAAIAEYHYDMARI